MTTERVDELLDQMAAHLHAELPPGWDSALLEWGEVADVAHLRHLTVLGQGVAGRRRIPEAVPSLLRSIADELADERGRPIWFELTFSEHEPGVGFSADKDRRLILDEQGEWASNRGLGESETRPTAVDWARELELHPREAQYVPDWWRQVVQTGVAARPAELPLWFGRPMPQTLADARAAERRVLPRENAVLAAPGYSELAAELEQRIFESAEQCDARTVDALFGRAGIAAQAAARRELVTAAARATLPSAGRLPLWAASRMLWTWCGAARRPRPAHIARQLDGEVALADAARTDPDARAMMDDLEPALAFLATSMARRRFGELPRDWPVV